MRATWIITLGTIALLAIVIVLSFTLPSVPKEPEALTRLSAVAPMLLTAALAAITAFYAAETRRIAQATNHQAVVLRDQLQLEYEPNLILVQEPGSYAVVNLGRHAVHIDGGTIRMYQQKNFIDEESIVPTEQLSRRLRPTLRPAEKALVNIPLFGRAVGKPPFTSAEVTVRFFYGSTGPVLHENVWRLRIHDSGDRSIEIRHVGPLPRWPVQN